MRFRKDLKNVNMKKLFRRNQIIVTTLAVMIAAAGYLNYTEKQTSELQSGVYEVGAMEISDEDILEENQMMMELETIADQAGMENPGEAILTSGMSVADYIAGVQLSREQIRAKNKDALLNIINNTNIEEGAKQQAIQEMLDLTEIAEKENAAETLLMAKGFADPVVSVSADKVDVVVNAASITDAERAQIEDIVKRKTEVGAESIIITLLNLSE